MNPSVLPASCRQKKLGSADETSAARCSRVRLAFPRFKARLRVQFWRLRLSMNPKIERLNSCASSLWWGEATDEPAREDARPTNGSNARPMLEVEASD